MVTALESPIIGWFGPPSMASSESTRRARALWFISWSFFGLLAVLLIAASIVTPSTVVRRAVSIGAVGVLVLLLHILNRRGRTALASWLLVLGLTLIVTQRAWNVGGVHAPVALFYIMFVLMAAGLLGVRGSIVVAAACISSATFLVGAETAGWIAPLTRPGSVAEAYIAVLLALGVTLVCLTLLLRQAEDLARDDLVNMFVHDMRSPLTVVMENLTMLREDFSDSPEVAEHADAAMAETIRVNRMANNLLDISRLEAARLPLQRTPTDVAQVARSVTRALGALDPTRQIGVRARMPVVCECDTELVRRIIENLVSNAIKHTDSGGHILVEVSSKTACVHIAVEDDGPGVPKQSRDRIFDRYSATGMNTVTGAHSVGLGLAFCKLAIAAHGGKIWVEDALPRGSRFVVELPTNR
jgi:signal transduction histidine kinase